MLTRIIGYIFGIGAFMLLSLALVAGFALHKFNADLPDYDVLAKYEPPVMTRIHAADGALVAEYAKERRLYLPIQAIPDLVKVAFISAEDKNFYEHGGIDPMGIARAVLAYAKSGGNARLQGASTITQQVTKNFLLTNERTLDRKAKEALLALRIEQAYSKDKILELYLNEIYLGLGSYGVAAAALNYYDKSVNELTIADAAYLAALPKAPENYNPFRDTERAVERRNWVIDRMVENGYIRVADAEAAKQMPLDVTPRPRGTYLATSEFFAEEVRRNLIDMYGADKLYEGGLSVRATLDPELQRLARSKLQRGLIKFDQRRGYRGPVQQIDVSGDWGTRLGEVEGLSDVPEWRIAVVLSTSDGSADIGFKPGNLVSGELADERETDTLPLSQMTWAKSGLGRVSDLLEPGDVIYVERVKTEDGEAWALRQPPEVQGAMVAMDPYTGRVLAMVGGFSFAEGEFNRATQAMRQPGSSFKPFIYAAALDNGYTPSSVILDAPIEIQAGNEVWRPQNYGGKFYGPSTLRTGIEKSRNVMTVRLAQDMGMPLVSEYSRRFGIYDDLQPYLSMALGAGETTLLRMVTGYSVIANGGRKITPTMIDRIQDRFGRTIYQHDQRECDTCDAERWSGQEEPTLVDNREQVLDPMTAYQITSMMEGVVQRGTATVVRDVGKPIAGKTGTTNDEKDAWFIGFSPDLVVGVYLGYDQPRPMGKGSTGGVLAAPIVADFLKDALADQPPREFQVPPGINLIPIDPATGMQVAAGTPGTILESFKPGTAPPSSYSVIGYQDYEEFRDYQSQPGQDSGGGWAPPVSGDASRAIATGTGGLY